MSNKNLKNTCVILLITVSLLLEWKGKVSKTINPSKWDVCILVGRPTIQKIKKNIFKKFFNIGNKNPILSQPEKGINPKIKNNKRSQKRKRKRRTIPKSTINKTNKKYTRINKIKTKRTFLKKNKKNTIKNKKFFYNINYWSHQENKIIIIITIKKQIFNKKFFFYTKNKNNNKIKVNRKKKSFYFLSIKTKTNKKKITPKYQKRKLKKNPNK